MSPDHHPEANTRLPINRCYPERAVTTAPRWAGTRKRPAEQRLFGLSTSKIELWRLTFDLKVMRDLRPVTVEVTSDGAGLVFARGQRAVGAGG